MKALIAIELIQKTVKCEVELIDMKKIITKQRN